MCRGRMTVIVCQILWTVGSKSIPVPLLVSHSDWTASYYTLNSHWSSHCAGLACLETRHLMKLAWTHVSNTAWRVGRWPTVRTCVSLHREGMTGKVKVLPSHLDYYQKLPVEHMVITWCVLLNCCNVDNHILLSQNRPGSSWLGWEILINVASEFLFHFIAVHLCAYFITSMYQGLFFWNPG